MSALEECVGRKIPKLIAEGKPKDQAIAIAYSMCGEKSFDELSTDDKSAWLEWGRQFTAKYAQVTDCPNCTQRIKSLGQSRIGGYGVVWGSAAQKDIEGDYFTPQSNLWLDTYSRQPLIYNHAMGHLPGAPADMPSQFVFGTVEKATPDDTGLWIEAQVDEHNQWVKYVMELIDKGVLHWSSGSVPQLVKRHEDGWLESWPIVEMSTTPTPAEPRHTEIRRVKHYVTQQDDQPRDHASGDKPPGSSRIGPELNSNDEQFKTETEGTMALNDVMIAGALKASFEAQWPEMIEEVKAATKQGGNAVGEMFKPMAGELAGMLGISEDEALAFLVKLAVETLGAGAAETEVPEEPMMNTETPAALSVDMEELAEKVAEKMTEKSKPPAGGYVAGKYVNLNFGRERPESFGAFVKAVRDKDRVYLAKHQQSAKAQTKALGINPDTAGGYLVAPEQSNQVIELLRANSVVLPLCYQVPMNRDTLNIPKLTGGVTTYWVGENASITPADPTFGQITLVAKKMAAMVQISNELLEDSDPSVDALLREDFARAMSAEMDRVILLGSGIGNEPRGLLNVAGITKTALNAAPTYANLTAAVSRVELANVSETPGWTWVFNPRDKATFRLLVDTAGTYIWSEGGLYTPMSTPVPRGLLGYDWQQTTQIDIDVANNSETEIFFGQWKDVVVGMRKTIEIMASNEAGNAFQYDQTWIRAIIRMDVNIRHDESIEILTDVRA